MLVRTLQAADADALLAFEAANRHWFEQHVEARPPEFYTRPGVILHIAGYLHEFGNGRMHPCVLLDDGGAIIGRANLRQIDRVAGGAEVGYRIDANQTGRGLASAALLHLLQLARDDYGLRLLQAWVSPENPASARVLEKHGFVRVAGMPPHSVIVQQQLRTSFLYQRALPAQRVDGAVAGQPD